MGEIDAASDLAHVAVEVELCVLTRNHSRQDLPRPRSKESTIGAHLTRAALGRQAPVERVKEKIHDRLDEEHAKIRIPREQLAHEILVSPPNLVPRLERAHD